MNWMRMNDELIVCASVFTVSVLARPGTPSMRQWPLARSPIRMRSIISVWPMTTLPTSEVTRSTNSLSRSTIAASSRSAPSRTAGPAGSAADPEPAPEAAGGAATGGAGSTSVSM